MGLIRCPQCDRILASVACGVWTIHYAGREYVAERLLAVRCDRCHLRWQVVAAPGGGDVVLVPPEV